MDKEIIAIAHEKAVEIEGGETRVSVKVIAKELGLDFETVNDVMSYLATRKQYFVELAKGLYKLRETHTNPDEDAVSETDFKTRTKKLLSHVKDLNYIIENSNNSDAIEMARNDLSPLKKQLKSIQEIIIQTSKHTLDKNNTDEETITQINFYISGAEKINTLLQDND